MILLESNQYYSINAKEWYMCAHVRVCVCVCERERERERERGDEIHSSKIQILYLPMVLLTSKPKPFSDFPALCISASFLPRTD